jgi:hypothetical protein
MIKIWRNDQPLLMLANENILTSYIACLLLPVNCLLFSFRAVDRAAGTRHLTHKSIWGMTAEASAKEGSNKCQQHGRNSIKIFVIVHQRY